MTSIENSGSGADFLEAMDIIAKIYKEGGFGSSDIARKYPITAAPMPCILVEKLVRIIRLKKTNECYKTNGGVSNDEQLIDQRMQWQIMGHYAMLLRKLLIHFPKISLSDLIQVDQSLRLKRLKQHKWCLFFSTLPNAQEAYVFLLGYRVDIKDDEKTHIPICLRPLESQ